MDLLRFLYPFAIKYKKSVLLVFLTIAITSAIVVINPLIYGSMIDEITTDRELSILVFIVTGYFLLVITKVIIDNYGVYIYTKVGTKIVFDIRKYLFSHILSLPISFYKERKQGDIITRLTSDISNLEGFTTKSFIDLISDSIKLIAILVIMLVINYKLTLACVIVMPLFPFAFRLFSNKVKKYTQTETESVSKIMVTLQEAIHNVSIIKLFTSEELFSKKLEDPGDEFIESRLKVNMWMSFSAVFAELILSLATILILFIYGGYEIKNGRLTLGELLAFGIYLSQLIKPINFLFRYGVLFKRVNVSYERIKEYINYNENNVMSGNLDFDFKTDICFENVKFKYSDSNEYVLNDLNLTIEKGKKYGIAGESGAGKSTLLNILLKFYNPTDGKIIVDDNDFADINIKSYLDKISAVIQGSFLFNATILENLKLGNPDASIDDVIFACKVANIYEFIQSLEKGFDTIVGDHGTKLSGGQKQRLSIARALVKNPELLIFDEATSQIDSGNERIITSELLKLNNNLTMIIVAHRLTTIKECDTIYFIENGKVIEKGTHDDLMQMKGKYYANFTEEDNE